MNGELIESLKCPSQLHKNLMYDNKIKARNPKRKYQITNNKKQTNPKIKALNPKGYNHKLPNYKPETHLKSSISIPILLLP